jgi:2-keto-4-pentenoate hydratase/2-oxohepta-3-ene-1,7-dioic acid hydratase in catechol pathway
VANPLTQERVASVGEEAIIDKFIPALPSGDKPPAILCVGLNYKVHAAECGLPEPEYPVIFMKNPGSVTGHGSPVVVPLTAQDPEQVDYEVELAFIIGKDCKNATPENALSYVLGFVAANDISARNWQLKYGGNQFCRAKSFDTFCPVGPVLALTENIDSSNLKLSTTVNGPILQDSNTSDMIFDVARIVSFLSQGATLEAGTLVLTGTPQGVGMARKPPVWLKDGDEVTVTVEGLGSVTNNVVYEK